MNALSEAVADEIRSKLNADNLKLPSLPDTVIKVQQLMSKGDYAVAEISNILIRDASFAAVVLSMANSVRFNTSGKDIRNLTMAIQRIGADHILKLLIGVASKLFLNVKNPELRACLKGNHEHVLMVSAAAEQLAISTGMAHPGDTFLAALLHDQGKDALVSCIPDELARLDEAERMIVCDECHREMGARLLHKWQLPAEFIMIAQHHGIESPERPNLTMLDCIDVAELIAHKLEDGGSADDIDFEAHAPSRRLRLNQTQITGIIIDIEDRGEELQQTFAT